MTSFPPALAEALTLKEIKRASDILHVWYRQYVTLGQLGTLRFSHGEGMTAGTYKDPDRPWKNVPTPEARDFMGLATEINALADRHFPAPCKNRSDLLQAGLIFQLLENIAPSLDLTQRQIEHVRAIALPPERDVVILAVYMNQIVEGTEGRDPIKEVRRAAEMLRTLQPVYSALEKLMEVSEAMRFYIADPDGES